MTVTLPDNLWSPDLTTGFVPSTDLAHMQDTVQAALNNKPIRYRSGPDSGRTSPSGWTPVEGDEYYSTDTDFKWFYTGSVWIPAGGASPLIVMRRTSAGISGAAGDYRDFSATSAWTATGGVLRGATYSDGITVAQPGVYEVFWALRGVDPAPGAIVGITVNKVTGVGGDDLWAMAHLTVNVITIGTATGRVRLAAGDKLRLFAYPNGGTLNLTPNTDGRVSAQWGARWIAP